MVAPQGYDGPQLEIILRSTKPDNTPEVIEKLFSFIKNGSKIAIYQKDQSDGDLTDQTLKALSERDINKTEMKEFMDKVHMTKIQPEIDNMKVASSFVKWTFDNIINEVEDIIDAEKKIKHSQI